MHREPMILESGKICSSAVDTYLYTDSVPNCKMFTCLSLAAINFTHGIATRLEVGVLDGRAHIPVRSQPGSFPAKTSGNTEFPIIVLPGQKLYALFVTPQAGDDLRMYAHGYISEVKCNEKRSSFDGYVQFRYRYHSSR